jgi:hypothetical protein
MAEPEVDKNYLAGVGRRLDALIESVETEDYDPEGDHCLLGPSRGAGDRADDFRQCEHAYTSALGGTTRSATARAVQQVAPASTRVPSGNDPLWTKAGVQPHLATRPNRWGGYFQGRSPVGTLTSTVARLASGVAPLRVAHCLSERIQAGVPGGISDSGICLRSSGRSASP